MSNQSYPPIGERRISRIRPAGEPGRNKSTPYHHTIVSQLVESRTVHETDETAAGPAHKTVQRPAPEQQGVLVLALLAAAFLSAACTPPESNGITNSPPPSLTLTPPPPNPPKQITGRAFNGNTITYYTIDTAAWAAVTPQSIGITNISGDVEYTVERVGTIGQVGYIADTSAIQPNKAKPDTLDIPQGTTGFFTVQVSAKGDATMQSKKVLIAAGRIDVGAKLAMPDAPTLGTPASKKENITVDAATRKVRITALEAGTKFTVVPSPQFPDEAPKYEITYSAEGVGDNHIVKAIDAATGEITQGNVGNGDDIATMKARTADIAVKATAEAVGPYPALQDRILFTVEHYRWMRMAAGYYHTLAINSRGELYAWGANDNGQLGIGTVADNELAPQRVGNDDDWEAVSGGEYHSLALKSNGALYAWGTNDNGQLGIGSTDTKTTPQQVGTETNWKAVSAGGNHSLALKNDNTLYAWGANYNGQLGNGENGANFSDKSKDKTAPIPVGTERNWQSISGGYGHSAALKDNGTLYTWGSNHAGQLGDGSTTNRSSPTEISTGWKALGAGNLFTLALKTSNTIYAWGSNDSEQLGDGSTTTNRSSPTEISAGYKAVAGGKWHSLALKNDNTLYAWGHNASGSLGDGTFTNRNRPVKVRSDDTDWKAIDSGGDYSLALKDNGMLYAWGNKRRLGIGTDKLDKETPTPVPHP